MPAVLIHGTRIQVERTGDGPPLVLLHGLAETSESWLPVAAPLAERFTVIRYDLPGHGLSAGEAPVESGALAGLVAGLAALLDHFDLRAVHLAGHDLGGAIAQRLAYERPERVRTLILEGTLPAPLDAPPSALAGSEDAGAGAEGTALLAAAAAGPLLLAPSEPTGLPRLAAIDSPALVLVGESDAWPFQDGAELLHGWIPNSRLVRIPDAGHTPHLEQPDAFIRFVRAFLLEHERGR